MGVSLLSNISKFAMNKLFQNAPVVLGVRQTSSRAEELDVTNLTVPSYPYRIEVSRGPGDLHFLKYALQQTFFLDEPSVKLLKLRGTENCGELIPLLLEGIDYSESFIARSNANDEVVGFALNGNFNQCKLEADLQKWSEKVKEPRNRKLLAMWNSMSKQFDYNLILPNGKAMEIYYLGVVPHARKKGLAKKLMEYSLSCAKFRGYGIVQVVCTSDHTAKICSSLGMTFACTIDYDTLRMPNDGRPVVTQPPPPPNDRIKVYYQLLKC